MSYYTDITSPYIWTLLWRSQALSCHVVCIINTMSGGRILLSASAVKLSTQSFDCNLCTTALVSGLIHSSNFFSARSRYSKSVSISNSSNLFLSQKLVKKFYHSSNICSFLYWRMINPTMIGSLCSTSYNKLFTWSSLFNSLLLTAACVFPSLRYFVTVCVLQSISW